jgi:2-keto-4-pentenoate hydratase/2-oxohepta-3-ene-1,7-dioic acid hydratase in catechol pathway
VRWVLYSTPDNRTPRAGLLRDEEVHGLHGTPTLLQLLAAGALADAGRQAATHASEVLPLGFVRLHAPIQQPPSIRDFLSFEEHVANASAAMGVPIDPGWYEHPVFYFSNPAAVRDPGVDVPISPGSLCFDYEVEVAAVIGPEGANLGPAEAERYIAGFTILCDWSARDLQAAERSLGFGPVKGKGSSPLAWCVTATA